MTSVITNVCGWLIPTLENDMSDTGFYITCHSAERLAYTQNSSTYSLYLLYTNAYALTHVQPCVFWHENTTSCQPQLKHMFILSTYVDLYLSLLLYAAGKGTPTAASHRQIHFMKLILHKVKNVLLLLNNKAITKNVDL